MSAPMDISAEAVEQLADEIEPVECFSSGNCPKCGEYNFPELKPVAATLRALRAALTAAHRERDAWKGVAITCRDAGLEADATGYARGVRDAAALFPDSPRWQSSTDTRAAILALLPETKETRDDQ